jgi:hypothetical protein
MSNIKKLMMTAASGASGLNIEEVFSAHVYKGAGSAQNVVNNIDLSNEGGLVWIKNRGSGYNHELYDTERGTTTRIGSNQIDGNGTNSTGLTAFNSNGFTVGTSYPTGRNGQEYIAWTFRKEKKFFDVVTYTGNGGTQNISHNLGAVPGCIMVKRTDTTSNWIVYHRATAHGSIEAEDYALFLNTMDDVEDNTYWNDTAPTDSVFTIANNTPVNANGGTYVAYLFAHNDGDGVFGPTGDQDIIKCGSYQGNGLDDGPEIDLGFEPQFVIIKASQRTANWYMYDNMRGFTAQGVNDTELSANQSLEEYSGAAYVAATSTGFKITDNANVINSGLANYNKYIYIAIRRGPMATPTSANTVFWTSSLDGTAPTYNSNNFPVDMAFHRHIGAGTAFHLVDRLRQRVNSNENYLETSSGNLEKDDATAYLLGSMDYMNGWADDGTNTSYQSWMWRRAPSFFDVVPYNGNATAGHTVSHNLGVTPEMIWVKNRDNSSYNWVVYHKDIVPSGTANQMYLHLNTNDIRDNNGNAWNDTDPTDTQFTLGNWALVNGNGDKHIAYLFATIPGVSKVGGYTGNGSELTVDCGFTNGAKFVLIKNTEQTGNGSWYIFDTKRGIVSGNDSFLELNTVNAENTFNDWIDPHSSGFTVGTNNASLCVNGRDFIFYAIAA